MLTSSEVWDAIESHMPRGEWILLWDIYGIVEDNSELDDADRQPLKGQEHRANPQLVWGRNVRNVLQRRKQTGDIEWDGEGKYRLPYASSLSLDWLKPGFEYQRTALHEKLGGQQQGGISTPANSPVILIFTGGSGTQYGYQDRWLEEDVFLYAGEGQRGDMEWKGGNVAVRDHAVIGKDLLLFESVRKAWVRYVGQFVCNGFHIEKAPDVDGNERTAIVFELSRLADIDDSRTEQSVELDSLDLQQLRDQALKSSAESRTPIEKKTQVRIRSEAIKRYARGRAAGSCESCLAPAPFTTASGEPYLEVHHVMRLSDGGPDHPSFVVAICPNCHRRAHYSIDSESFRDALVEIVQQIESNRNV